MKKIFIDGGAHCGCSVKRFREIKKDAKDYIIYCFEPNPLLHKYLESRDDINFLPYALSTFDGEVELMIASTSGGSTIHEFKKKQMEKKYNQKFSRVFVKCIDLSQFLIKNFDVSDYIVVKLDIEGSEYEIVEKMMGDGSMAMVNEICGEWHNFRCGIGTMQDRMKGYKISGRHVSTYDLEIEKRMKDGFGLRWTEWDSKCLLQKKI